MILNKQTLLLCFLCYFVISSNVVFADPTMSSGSLNPRVIQNTNINSLNNNPEKLKNEYDSNMAIDEKIQKVITGNIMKEAPVIDSEKPKFTVNTILFEGNTKISNKAIKTLVKKSEGKQLSIDDLLNVCDQITALYNDKGYLTSKAVLLPQKVKSESVIVTIQEGKYGDITIEGNKWSRTSYLKRTLKSYGIKEGNVLNIYDLKNGAEEFNQTSYMKGDFLITQEAEPLKNDILLKIEDRFPLDLSANWNNAGQESSGKDRSIITVANNNITGNGDSLALSAFLSKSTLGTFENYSIPVGTHGTKFNLGHSFSNTKYGGMYKRINMQGESQSFTVGISQQVFQNKHWSVDTGINLDFGNTTQTMDYFGKINDVNLTVLRSGIYAKREDEKGLWMLNTTVNTGLPFLTKDDMTDNYYSKFVTTNFGINRLQMFPKRCYLLLNVNGQYSGDDLYSSEKMMLGGNNLRGYDPATLLGDIGVFGTIELRTPVPFLKNILRGRFAEFEDRTKLGFFYDIGGTKDSTGYKNHLTMKSTNVIQSIGVGINIPVGKTLVAGLNLGFPMGDPVFKMNNIRFSFSLTSNIHSLWSQKHYNRQREASGKSLDSGNKV